MRFCGICSRSEEECGPFKYLAKDFVLITEKPCCEECRLTYEGKPAVCYDFVKMEEEDDLGSIRANDLSKNSDSVSASV